MRGRGRAGAALLSALLLGAAGRSDALPIVEYFAVDLGGGLFIYHLTVDNAGGSEPLAGLNLLHGGSVFGLDASSAIAAPPGWNFFEPLPPLIDDLNYFSLTPGSDIPLGGELDGFWFKSTKDPDTLLPGELEVEGIGADSASQIPLGDAVPVPEPASALLVAAALAALGARARGPRSRARSPLPGEHVFW
jgi:hypothetical protein